MKKKRRFFFIPFFILAALAAIGAVVMLLWNAVVSEVFGLKPLTYLQAVGLFLLCKILFSSFRPGGGFRRGGHWRSKLMDLSPEEREKFKEEWSRRMRGNNH